MRRRARAGAMPHLGFLLELTPDRFRPKRPPAAGLTVVRAVDGDASRARWLWTEVGRNYWTERARWSGARWRTHLRTAAVSFWIASRGAQDVGFFELRRQRTGVKLEGFGLLPAWRGRGLGSTLLSVATQHALATGAGRIRLHTATDDHPNALPNYLARGYRVYRQTVLRHPMPPAPAFARRSPALDGAAVRFPVSVKGVIIRAGRVVLLRNERDEWELPGGKLEPSESPARCVAREIAEELRLTVRPRALLDAWVYRITAAVRVLVVTYGCSETTRREAVLSDEHAQLRWFALSEVGALPMPEGYKASIRAWANALRGGDVRASRLAPESRIRRPGRR